MEQELQALRMRPQFVAPHVYMALPYSSASPPSTLWYADVTTATFGAPGGSPWYAACPRLARLAIYVEVPYTTAGGGTGEVRVALSGASTNASPVQAISAASGTLYFTWLHGADLWGTHVNINIDARRTSGGFSVISIGYPTICLVDPAGAT